MKKLNLEFSEFYALMSTAVLILLGSTIVNGQVTKIDNIKLTAYYSVDFQPDSTNPSELKHDDMILYIGSKSSRFLSLNSHNRDSVKAIAIEEGYSPAMALARVNQYPKPRFKYHIYKNYPAGKITVQDKVMRDNYVYQEDLDLFAWKLLNETDTIAGLFCQKAITQFEGRTYEAWFAPSIAVQEGPYKFNGLPGLIVKIYDTKKHYTFQLTRLETTMEGRPMYYEEPISIKTSKAGLYKVKREFNENMVELLAQSGITLINKEDEEKLRKMKSQENNPLELLKH